MNDDFNRDDVLMPDDPQETAADPRDTPLMTLSPNLLMTALVAVTFLLVGVVIGTQLSPASGLTAAEVERVVRSVLSGMDFAAAGGSGTNRFELVDDDPYIGAEDAPIVIVEFSDFRCPYCGRHYAQTLTPLLENYGQHIRYVYRDMAILSQESVLAAQAGECAKQQNKFWEFHNTFFSNQNNLTEAYFRQVAVENGLDMAAFDACLKDPATVAEVENDRIAGYINGVEGTPGFFINGNFVRGAQPYEIFEAYVQRELERAGISAEAGSAG